MIERVSALQIPDYTRVGRTSDLEEFFKSCGIQDAAKWFKGELGNLYHLIHSNRISSGLNWHDLLGMEFYKILLDIKSLRQFISEEEIQNLIEEWEVLYLTGYLGLLRVKEGSKTPPVTNATNIFFNLPKDYCRKLNEFYEKLEGALQQGWDKRKGGKSVKVQEAIDKSYKETVLPLLQRWKQLKPLMMKFLLHPRATHLLTGPTLIEFPGGHAMDPSNEKEANDALKTIRLYYTLIARSLKITFEKRVVGVRLPIFDELHSRTTKLASAQKSQDIEKESRELIELAAGKSSEFLDQAREIEQEIAEAKSGNLTQQQYCEKHNIRMTKAVSQETFIEQHMQRALVLYLSLAWLEDLRFTFEHSILCHLDPSHHFSEAYCNRINLNMRPALLGLIEESAVMDPSSLEVGLERVRSQFCPLFQDQNFTKIIGDLNSLNRKQNPLLSLMRPPLRQLYEKLGPFVEGSLKELSTLAETHRNQCVGAPLLEKTLWLVRLYILYNDLAVFLHEKDANEEEILPRAYLDFLSLEQPEGLNDMDPQDALSLSPHSSKANCLSHPASTEASNLSHAVPSNPLQNDEIITKPSSDTSTLGFQIGNSDVPALPSLSKEIVPNGENERTVPAPKLTDTLPSLSQSVQRPGSPLPSLSQSVQRPDSPLPSLSRSVQRPDSPPPSLSRSLEKKHQEPSLVDGSGEIAREILGLRKHRDIERVLRRLGLAPISRKQRGHGSHAIWTDGESKLTTVLPDSKEIPLGTVRAIYRQVSSSAAAAAPPNPPRSNERRLRKP